MLVTLIFILVGVVWSAVKYNFTYGVTTRSSEAKTLVAVVLLPLTICYTALVIHSDDVTLYTVRCTGMGVGETLRGSNAFYASWQLQLH